MDGIGLLSHTKHKSVCSSCYGVTCNGFEGQRPLSALNHVPERVKAMIPLARFSNRVHQQQDTGIIDEGHDLRPLSRASLIHEEDHKRITSCQTNLSSDIDQMLADLNGHVALLRQLLITIGQSRDSPEVREKIRRLRRQCVDACKHITQMLLPQIRSDVAAGIPVDKDHLVHFFCCTQLLARELRKSLQLIRSRPLDMSNYYDNRPGPSSLGGVLSQIILCKQLAPDFNQEEVCSIRKDSEEIQRLIDDMQEFMPMEETNGRAFALAGEDKFSLWARRRIKERQGNSLFSTSFRSFCCLCKPTYL